MAYVGRIVLVWMVGLTVGAVERRAHAQDTDDGRLHAEMRVSVRIYNNADVAEDVLQYAKAYAAQVFRRIHVGIEWLDRPGAVFENPAPQYAVVMMTPQAADRKAREDAITDEVVGQAAVRARRAYIYYDRVLAMALPPDRDLVTFLGYVIAHELGHLMLPPHSHSAAGIMRGSFGLSSRTLQTFTAKEGEAIRRRLAEEAKWTRQLGAAPGAPGGP